MAIPISRPYTLEMSPAKFPFFMLDVLFVLLYNKTNFLYSNHIFTNKGWREMYRNVASKIIMVLLLMGTLTLAFKVQPVNASGTIYIRVDGSIDPPTAAISSIDNITYTLTNNIYDSIVVERNNIIVDGAGYIVHGNASGIGIDLSYRINVTIKDANIKSFTSGIWLYISSNNNISGNKITNNRYGIYLNYYSNYSIIAGNEITNNSLDGIVLVVSSNNIIRENSINNGHGIGLNNALNNTIYGNNLTNIDYGVWLGYSSNNNVIYGNNITNHIYYGVDIFSSSYNTIYGNNIANNRDGIHLHYSSHNIIYGNNIINNNRYGILLGQASKNKFHHNNIIKNSQQAYVPPSYANTWDDSYPSGGNYWSDHADVDLYSGPYQNETGTDGIWDHSYVIDANNKDRYPLVNPWTPTIHGIDVSHHQGEINWTRVYSGGYRFAFVKATEGDARPPVIIDPNFETNINNGSNAGLLMGAYHLAHPEMNNAVDEAQFFVSIAGSYLKGEYLRPALDLEQEIVNKVIDEKGKDEGKRYLSNWVETWISTVKEETGVEPIIYVSSDSAENYLNKSIAKYNLWIAHYTYDPDIPPRTGIWDSWDFWQWSNESKYASLGYVPGISGDVDLDVFNGGMPKLYNSFIIRADIGITEIAPSKSVIGQGYNVLITTTIVNYGDPIETFNVTIYANETSIALKTITLAGNNSTTLTFTWNTTGVAKGNHTITAKATQLPYETDTTDNTLTDGWIIVAMVGDLTGPDGYPEGKCDMRDVYVVARAFGSHPNHPRWNPNADITGPQGLPDEKVDMRDIYVVARNFGKTDP